MVETGANAVLQAINHLEWPIVILSYKFRHVDVKITCVCLFVSLFWTLCLSVSLCWTLFLFFSLSLTQSVSASLSLTSVCLTAWLSLYPFIQLTINIHICLSCGYLSYLTFFHSVILSFGCNVVFVFVVIS